MEPTQPPDKWERYRNPPPMPHGPPPPKPRQSKTTQLLLSIPLAIALFVVIGLVARQVLGETPAGPSSAGAVSVCRSFVEKQLKAPASAEFAGADETSVDDLDNGSYRVHSYVDAQNSFGVPLRTKYTCEVEHIAEGRYRLVDLQTDP